MMTVVLLRWALITIWCIVLIANVACGQSTAAWMSGNHGVGFRIPGGVNMETCIYDVDLLVNQIKNEIPQVTWILLGISSGAYGDQYISPHSILTDLNRASTPRQTEDVVGLPDWLEINANGLVNDFTLEDYPERDLFSEIANAFQAEGFKIIAYLAPQGPSLLKHTETRAYDYNSKSPYVDSITDCNVLTSGEITDGTCSPSVRRWKNHVISVYGNDTDATLKQAYAELIVKEYANKFDGQNGRALVDGWWFDQGVYMDIPRVHTEIKAANPNAAIAFNTGPKVPLANNNPPYEAYTSGHPKPIGGKNPTDPYDVSNEPIMTSIEDTTDGYFESQGSYSLGHAFQMTNDAWNNGELVWNGEKLPQAIEWMSRVINARGAWTWNVKRSFNPTTLHKDDVALLKKIYAGVAQSTSPTTQTPTTSPTTQTPTILPTTQTPTISPATQTPTISPTTKTPIVSPTTQSPTGSPTTQSPTTPPIQTLTISPTISPTILPTTQTPTISPTTQIPTTAPTQSSTILPTTQTPTTSPTQSQTTSTPTTSPTKKTTISPSTLEPTMISPTTSPVTTTAAPQTDSPTFNSCSDSPLIFLVQKVEKSCLWVDEKPNKRCKRFSSHCLQTCSSCESCVDSSLKFEVTQKGKVRLRSCAWVGKKDVEKRCSIDGISGTCQLTCGSCTSPPTVAPSCYDSLYSFDVTINNEVRRKSCVWVANRPKKICKDEKFSSHCPQTCSNCDVCKDSLLKFSMTELNGDGSLRSCQWAKKKKKKRCRIGDITNTCRLTCEGC